jgi:hypothetical protein
MRANQRCGRGDIQMYERVQRRVVEANFRSFRKILS